MKSSNAFILMGSLIISISFFLFIFPFIDSRLTVPLIEIIKLHVLGMILLIVGFWFREKEIMEMKA